MRYYKITRIWKVNARNIDDALKKAKKGMHKEVIIDVIKRTKKKMKHYKVLIDVSAECEDDLEEVLECMHEEHPFEREWWCEYVETK